MRYEHPHGWAWIYARADQPMDPGDLPLPAGEVDRLFSDQRTLALLVQLADAFAPVLPITAAQWELDLRKSPWPETLLRLWESVLGAYTCYVSGKKLPPGAVADYFWLILDFCNTGAADFLSNYRLRSLKAGRVARVIGELRRWFRRESSL